MAAIVLRKSERSQIVRKTAARPKKTHKSFLVEGGRDKRSIFRVVVMEGGVTRRQVETLLCSLPIGFNIYPEGVSDASCVNEVLDVYVSGGIITIHPPRFRIIGCTTFDSWGANALTSKMRVNNVMDMMSPGYGQIRTSVHFDPRIFGINGWPNTEDLELELDIHVYPKTRSEEPKIKPLSFSKFEVRKLLELIAGGERALTVDQFDDWRDLVMVAVMSMKANYENPHRDKKDPVSVYYRECWERIARAKTDEKMVEALESLRSSIRWE